MRVKLWTEIAGGAITANVEISLFTASEKTQATKFGTLTLNIGGAFAAVAAGPDPAVNFSLEPINLLIDPANAGTVTYSRTFKVTAEVPNPGLAAKVFCETNQVRLTDAVSQWKALTEQYATNIEASL